MSEQESDKRTPDLPTSATTTADMGMKGFFDMNSLNDLLTKGNLSSVHRALYMNVINISLIYKRKGLPKLAQVYWDRATTDLKAMVGEKAARIKSFQLAFENELHHEKRKTEEKPQI